MKIHLLHRDVFSGILKCTLNTGFTVPEKWSNFILTCADNNLNKLYIINNLLQKYIIHLHV